MLMSTNHSLFWIYIITLGSLPHIKVHKLCIFMLYLCEIYCRNMDLVTFIRSDWIKQYAHCKCCIFFNWERYTSSFEDNDGWFVLMLQMIVLHFIFYSSVHRFYLSFHKLLKTCNFVSNNTFHKLKRQS